MAGSKRDNNASIMVRHMLWLVVSITIISGAVSVFAVGQQLLGQADANADQIIISMKKTVIDDDADWANWRKNSTLNTWTSYVHIHNARNTAKTKDYYSPDAKGLFVEAEANPVPFLGNVSYVPHFGLILINSGSSGGIQYTLWTSLDDQLETLERVVVVAALVMILTLIISPIYIRLIAKRLTAPLVELTDATQNVDQFTGQKQVELPEPIRPTEVHQLAVSFNRLLGALHDQSAKEKAFVSNAAHELRTPIATILSNAQLIQRRGREHPEIIARSLEYISSESRQMQGLVDELLILSRADRAQLAVQAYDLSNSLSECIDRLRTAISQPIQTEITPNIWVLANQESVEQIVSNLLSNAAKYSPADTTIRVRVAANAETAQVDVIDLGRGIAEEAKQQIFQRFYRAEDVRSSIPGTGLGLSIVQQLVQLNQATIAVHDNPQGGAVFTVTLPLADHS